VRLPGLSSSQSGIVLQATRAPSWRKAPPIAKKALLEALGVESTFGNPNFGDRDSLGSLQQRANWGSARSRLNVAQSAERFLQQAIPLSNRVGSSGELAQDVQRSGFPLRYGQHSAQASSLLRALHGGGVGGGGGGISSFALSPVKTTTQQTVSTPTVPSSAGLPTPAFSAQNELALPKSFGQIPSGGGPAPPSTVTTTTSTSGGGIAGSQGAPAGTGGPNRARGQFVLDPGANRPGVNLAGDLKHFVSLVAGRFGRTLRIGTGTAHSRLTTTGNVSDHWDGHAVDIPAPVDSAKGDRIATAALIAAGVPSAKARQMARRGGAYTLDFHGHRVQVLWKTDVGGNHHNHIHVGFR
jgi:hypothetical protein